MPARYGRRAVVCGAPNCRPGIVTACTSGNAQRRNRKASIGGIESDGMLASGAELGINRDTAGIIELATRARRAPRHLRPTTSSKSITSRSRTGRICGAITEWPAKWRRSLASRCAIRWISRCCPQGPPRSRSRSKISNFAPDTARWCLRTSPCRPSPLWLQAGWKRWD